MAPRVSPHLLIAVSLVLAFTTCLPASAARADDLDAAGSSVPSLGDFVKELVNGQGDQLRGIYAGSLFADRVTQQPIGEPGFISAAQGTLTQFEAASQFGAMGLLAHNYLAGAQFSQLHEGQVLHLVYGDGHTQTYVVTQRLSYQALQPNSDYSSFLDLRSGERLSAFSLFSKMYDRSGSVVLQTCIEADGVTTWGRLFVIAEPVLSLRTQQPGLQAPHRFSSATLVQPI